MVLFIAQGVISDITDRPTSTSPKIVGSVAAVPPTPASTARTASTSAAQVQKLSAALADTPRRPVEEIRARRTLATDATFATPTTVVHRVPTKKVSVRLSRIPTTALAPPTPCPPTPTPTKTPPPTTTSAYTAATISAVRAALEERLEARAEAKAALGEAAAIFEKSGNAAPPRKSAGRLSRTRTLSVTSTPAHVLHRVNTTSTPAAAAAADINKATPAHVLHPFNATSTPAAAAAAININKATPAAAAKSDNMDTQDESAYHTMDTDNETTVDTTARVSCDFLSLPKVCKILRNIPCSNKYV